MNNQTVSNSTKKALKGDNLQNRILKAVINQLGYDANNLTKDDLKYISQSFSDITNHGARSGGFSGFTYYCDTVYFYDKHEDDIWELLEESRNMLGETTILSMIGNFNGAKDVGSNQQFKNLLAWFTLEEVARTYADN